MVLTADRDTTVETKVTDHENNNLTSALHVAIFRCENISLTLQASFYLRLSVPPKGFSDQVSLRSVALSNLHYSGVDKDRETFSPTIISKLLPDITTEIHNTVSVIIMGSSPKKNPRFIILHFEGPPDPQAPPCCGVWVSAGALFNDTAAQLPHTCRKKKMCKSWKWTNVTCVLSGAVGGPENQDVWEGLKRTSV